MALSVFCPCYFCLFGMFSREKLSAVKKKAHIPEISDKQLLFFCPSYLANVNVWLWLMIFPFTLEEKSGLPQPLSHLLSPSLFLCFSILIPCSTSVPAFSSVSFLTVMLSLKEELFKNYFSTVFAALCVFEEKEVWNFSSGQTWGGPSQKGENDFDSGGLECLSHVECWGLLVTVLKAEGSRPRGLLECARTLTGCSSSSCHGGDRDSGSRGYPSTSAHWHWYLSVLGPGNLWLSPVYNKQC